MEHESGHFPNRLRKHRMMMGYKQKDIAYLLGLVSTNRISKWEGATAMPNVTNLNKLSVIYHVFPTDLYFDLMQELKRELSQKEQFLQLQLNASCNR